MGSPVMTSRERVEATLNFRQPDRVPIDCSGMRSTGIAAVAYGHLKRHLGLDGEPPHVYDVGQMLAEIEEPVRQRFQFDIVPLESWRATWRTREAIGQWTPRRFWDGQDLAFPADLPLEEDPVEGWFLADAAGQRTRRMPRGGFYFDAIASKLPPPSDELPMPPLAAIPWQKTIPDEELDWLQARARWIYEHTPYAMLGAGYGHAFSAGFGGIPWSDWMCLLAAEPNYCRDGLLLAAEAEVARLELVEQAVGRYVSAWMVAADDMGTQKGEQFRQETFLEVIQPAYAHVCHWMRQHSRMKSFLHSCGSIYHLVEGLIDAGLDCLNPVQTSAANMDPRRLKAEFGGRIIFWGGGCDTQHTLWRETPEAVAEHVRERLEIFAPGGGFIFCQVHNVQANVPPENIVAMYDAVARYNTAQTGATASPDNREGR
jgi:uroporphyrinogen decarboxylase